MHKADIGCGGEIVLAWFCMIILMDSRYQELGRTVLH